MAVIDFRQAGHWRRGGAAGSGRGRASRKEQKQFIPDITGLEYIDSSGVGMLVSSLTQVKKAGGELRLAGANARIQRILSMTGVNSLFPMFPTLADATAA